MELTAPILYCRKPLEDPTTQIRLLKHRPQDNLGWPSFDLTRWTLGHAPPYNAISYTWGEPKLTSVVVNGMRLGVRRNCYDALRQALEYDHAAYIWVDSICINQDNIPEKNAQVQRMFDTYKNAKCVLACVGKHADNSELIVKVCKILEVEDREGAWEDFDQFILVEVAQLFERHGLDLLGKSGLEVHQALTAFGKRPFWTRMWIVQELCAGSHAITLLCGGDIIDWAGVRTVFKVWTAGDRAVSPLSDGPMGHMLNIITEHESSKFGVPVEKFLGLAEHLGCSDARDMIYGAIKLLDWQRSGLRAIFPDYDETAWNTAKQIAFALRIWRICQLMATLKIDLSCREMSALLTSRNGPNHLVDGNPITRDFSFGASVTVVKLFVDCASKLCIKDDTGTMKEYFGLCGDSELPTSFARSSGRKLSAKENPQIVFFDGKAVALVGSYARAGDLMVTWPHMSREGYIGFVLRQSHEAGLDVIGTCLPGKLLLEWMSTGAWSSESSLPYLINDNLAKRSMFRAGLRLKASIEDVMLLFHLDRANKPEERSPNSNLRRLTMRPLNQPKGAAKLESIPFSPFGLEDYSYDDNEFQFMDIDQFTR